MMFLVQDYRPNDGTFGYPLALPEPKQYGVPEGYDIPIFEIFRKRDIERIRIDDNIVVFSKRERRHKA